jgi:alkaline phosphatase
MKTRVCLSIVIALWYLTLPASSRAGDARSPMLGSVIFIHPDGTSASSWAAARNLYVGPDHDLHWDRLPAMALYRGHMADSLTATSHGGATTHAHGIKVAGSAYGLTAGGETGKPIVDGEGQSLSVAQQAIRAGLPVGVVQTGTNTEPGTGCFLTAVPRRSMHDQIAAQLIASGAEVILGGGEQFFLPKGAEGVHGPGARHDNRDLIDEARKAGYTVVRTREQLKSLKDGVPKVLGLFAANHTFNDKPEEELAAKKLPLYAEDAPTVAEMTDVALRILTAKGKRFLLIVEEEGTDNFGNKNNARGMLEAMRRADEAIGLARRYVHEHPATLLITAADSDAGGMRLVGIPVRRGADVPQKLPPTDANGAPMDGVLGTGSAPFVAAPDRAGRTLPFAIVWAARDDVTGGILVRGAGINSHLVHGNMDNTEIAHLIRLTLFGRSLPRK